MTEQAIRKQIDVIDRATEEALKSKKSAHQFLVDAGIVKGRPSVRSSPKKKEAIFDPPSTIESTGFHDCDRKIGLEVYFHLCRKSTNFRFPI